MTEQELLVDCLRRLNGAEITYYLTGSMASNYWGIPRTTHDLDFVIQLPPSAIGKIVSAFAPDYFIDEASVRAAYQPPHQFNAIDTRSALKVDFWLPKPEPFDREMLQRRVRVTLFGEPAGSRQRRIPSCTSWSGTRSRPRNVNWLMLLGSSPFKARGLTNLTCENGPKQPPTQT